MKKYKIMAAVFALLTGISLLLFFTAIQNSSQKGYANVVVAVKMVGARTMLTADMVKLQKVPLEAVHPDAARKISDVVGMVTSGTLETGETVLKSKLAKLGSQTGDFAYQIPDGMRAVTIQVDIVSGVGGQLKAGDMVDVISEFDLKDPNSVTEKPTSLMLLQNIEVLATGGNSSQSSKGSYTTVTLAVKSDDDALKLNLAATSGKIRLALRPPLDKGSYTYTPQTPEGLIK